MKNRGITLISMVIAIIVMAIIAGVSVNMIISGDDSVITRANESAYKNSITQIEEKLNEIYVQNYSKVEEKNSGILSDDTPATKARALAYYFEEELKNSIFVESAPYTNYPFTDDKFAYVSKEGYIFYLLSPEKLMSYDSSLKVLELREPKDRDSIDDISNLYAVTSDLRVFVIKDDLDNIVGIDKKEIKIFDFNTVIFREGSSWAKILGDGTDITYQQVQSSKKITVDFKTTSVDASFNFSQSSKLVNLNELVIKNCDISDISGIVGSKETLKTLQIIGGGIKDYKGIEQLKNLEILLISDFKDQNELDRLLSKVALGQYKNLHTIAIMKTNIWGTGAFDNLDYETYQNTDTINTKITNLDEFSKFKTKNTLKKLYLYQLGITSLKPLEDFTNLEGIRAESNLIKSMDGLGNKPNLKIIRMARNQLTTLEGLVNNSNLTWIDIRNNKSLNSIPDMSESNISNSLEKIWFKSKDDTMNDSDAQLETKDIIKNKECLIKLNTNLYIDSKYSRLLLDENLTQVILLKNISESDELPLTDIEFESFANYTNITKFSINNVTIINSTSKKPLSESETNSLINKVFKNKNLKTIKYLQILNMENKVSNAEFLSNLTKLVELDFRNNTATNIDGAPTTLRKLSIDNAKINLTSDKMQAIISNLDTNEDKNYFTYGRGLVLCNDELFGQLVKCEKITKLYMYRDWHFQIGAVGYGKDIDLSKCTSLKSFYCYNIYCNFTLPNSVKSVYYYYVYKGNQPVTDSYDKKKTPTIYCYTDNIYLNLENCFNLETLCFGNSISSNIVHDTIMSIPDKAKETFSKLTLYDQQSLTTKNSEGKIDYVYLNDKFVGFNKFKTLEITGYKHHPIQSINGVCKIESLEELNISWVENIDSLPDMSGLKNLKKLSIINSSITAITDESKLRDLKNLEEISIYKTDNYFKGSNLEQNYVLTSIPGLIPRKNSDDFEKLYKIILKNNGLENNFSVLNVNYNIKNDIIKPLFNKNLRELYVEGNKIDDLAEISNWGWKKKSGF